MLKWAKPGYRRQETKDGRYFVVGNQECCLLRKGWMACRSDMDEPIWSNTFPTRWEAKLACEKDAEEDEQGIPEAT